MRCYHLCNMYLSPIQQGIQAAHAQMELFVKYNLHCEEGEQLYDWAENHKTMICLNGGFLSHMEDLKDFLDTINTNTYPWSTFYEAEESLGGMLTNIAIVLPERIYECMAVLNMYKPGQVEFVSIKGNGIFLLKADNNGVHFLDLPECVREAEYSYFDIELMSRLRKLRLA